MEPEIEPQLIKDAQKDIKAFDRLYEMYFPKIYAYCLNRLANKEATEDVVSQVFLLTVEQIHKFNFRKSNSLGPWLYKIAHNKIIDYYRYGSNKKLTSLESVQVGYEPDFDRSLQLSDLQKKIALVLSLINPRYQEIISLKFFQELANEEIAEIIKEKPKNVAVILHRALKSFKQEFKKRYPETEINLDL